ncbi:elongation factor EF-2 [Candidatus Pacearchaeota archaeon ex4484_31]|nr:MAG: elongation factor EF-2 [Candidatus Pacearchaeota archaeon ex4484_31]
MAKDRTKQILELMNQRDRIRNIGIAAHIDHGKTTMTDSLLAGAGMISEELAGKLLVMDFHEDEKKRGITIDSANVNMIHNVDGKDYLINLIDTPGHVDFSGEVTRAMRACDGAVVLVDAAEGMMPQTETVLKQALKERVKPVLFINKVDRLIKELKLKPEEMQKRLLTIINDVNKFIKSVAPQECKQWHVSVEEGSVCFGSAKDKWALSYPFMKKTNVTFKDVFDAYEKNAIDELSKKAPLYEVVMDMVVKHLPSPLEAQRYRIPKIWHGDLESEEGKALINCDPNGPVVFIPTKIVIDKHAGEVAGGRLFSGTVRSGQELYLNLAKKWVRVQQVNLYKGPQRLIVDEATAGNIIGIVGLTNVFAGETVSSKPIEPFEELKHFFEPVVTCSIEAKKPADLPKLINVLRHVAKEDPTVSVKINEETGQHLLSGLGELHLDVIVNRIKTEKGVDVVASKPIVVYRETVTKESKVFEGRSPNKHNIFYLKVEPLEDSVYQAIKNGELPEMKIKKKDEKLFKTLEALGVSPNEIRQYKEIYRDNVFLDKTRGIVHIGEVIELVMAAFEQICDAGILAKEPCMKLKVSLVDCKLHEDAIHRGPAQVIPAVRDALKAAILDAKPVLYEPLQIIQIETPANFMGEVTKIIASKRGQLLGVDQEGERLSIRAKMPVSEMFGLTNELRSATEGRAAFFIVDQLFEQVPKELQEKIIRQIKERKGIE